LDFAAVTNATGVGEPRHTLQGGALQSFFGIPRDFGIRNRKAWNEWHFFRNQTKQPELIQTES
jgi:hypothetical protein